MTPGKNPSAQRILLLAALALGVSASLGGCSDIDCSEIQRYNGAELKPKLVVPPGMEAPAVRDSHVIPGGAPLDGATHGGCLVKPPVLVEVPKQGD